MPFEDPVARGRWRYALTDEEALVREEQVPSETLTAGEIYLELQQLDLASAEAVLAFVNSRGPLGGSFYPLAPFGFTQWDLKWPWLLQTGLGGHETVRAELVAARELAESTTEPERSPRR